MKTFELIVLAACGLLSVAADAQQTYDGRNGPHVFGSPGQQVYIRGQNEGTYSVPGVGGQFQNAPSRGEHVYTDEQGNTFVHRKNAGGPATHSVSGPSFSAQNLGQSRQVTANALDAGAAPRLTRQIHIARPDRTVDIGYGGVYVQRARRSPQEENEGIPIIIRRRRGINDARVQGENFVARGDQAGVWNDNVSVWKRPDGRTVTVDKNGHATVSGRRGTQHYN